jgi:hypothetical protein
MLTVDQISQMRVPKRRKPRLTQASFSWSLNNIYGAFRNTFGTSFTNLVSMCIF